MTTTPNSSRIWVKICANTTLADARHAAEAGADAVGFVFAPSRRQVTAEQVREIAAGLPDGVERVGVFAAQPAEEIAAATKHARLTALQLHGGFDLALSARLRELLGPEVALIQTVHWNVEDPDAERRPQPASGGLEPPHACCSTQRWGALPAVSASPLTGPQRRECSEPMRRFPSFWPAVCGRTVSRKLFAP